MMSNLGIASILSLLCIATTSCLDGPHDRLGQSTGAASGSGEGDSDDNEDDGDVGVPHYEDCEDILHCEGSVPAEQEDLGSDPDPEPYYPAPTTPCSPDDANAGSDPLCRDNDGDGTKARWDCDDNDPTRHRYAFEIACDGIDQNCDGTDYCDSDGDGVADLVDCDPNDPLISDQCRVDGEAEQLD